MATAIRDPVPDRVKPSFVIFDIRALWHCKLWLIGYYVYHITIANFDCQGECLAVFLTCGSLWCAMKAAAVLF